MEHRFRLVSLVFSVGRRHTRCYRDWSSDVCSSDLEHTSELQAGRHTRCYRDWSSDVCSRSEERRGGKECRSRWSPYHSKKITAQFTGLFCTSGLHDPHFIPRHSARPL